MAAEPKRKISTQRKGKRLAAKNKKFLKTVLCKHCSKQKLPHHVCPHCGKA